MTRYEWVVEPVDEYGDIIEVCHADTFRAALEHKADKVRSAAGVDLALVREVWHEDGSLEDRQWAYLEDGALPAKFDGGARVPKRYIAELAR